MRMLQLRAEGDLALEPFRGKRGGGIRGQDLYDDLPIQFSIRREEYMRHAATTELALDGVRTFQRRLDLIAE